MLILKGVEIMTNKIKNKAPASPRETIIIMQPDAGLRASAGRFETKTAESVSDLKKVLKKYKANMVPIFGSTEERIEREMMSESAEGNADMPMPDLNRFYKLEVDDEQAEEAAEAMAGLSQVEAAFVKPGAEPPVMLDDHDLDATPMQNEPTAPVTPDFVSRQSYLDPSPVGIDARWANARAGGRGQNVRIIDIEGAWRFSHEDLRQMQGGVVGGTQSTNIDWRNHGTAVLGVYSGDHNRFGISGICDQAMASAVSIFGGMGSAAAIRSATSRLRSGDILLIELHRPGPRHNFQSRADQKGYIAIEWWEDDYAAILAATRRGIIVVEAAGNGAENLDDDIYQVRPSSFPSSWSNPFRRSNRDSGAIIVGAGAPPPRTHGRDHGPDRSRLGFSNYGELVDAQGWGREVTTCGYGDLQGGTDEDIWYTDKFSGTSSASPIVVGAIASLQGMARARGSAVLSPAKVRQCLRSTGAEQTDASGRPRTQRIGTRPDLKELYQCAFKTSKEIKEKERLKEQIKEFKEKEHLKERIKEFKEKERIKDIKEKERLKERIKDIKEKELIKERKEFKEFERFDNKQIERLHDTRLTSQDNDLDFQPDLTAEELQLTQEMFSEELKYFENKEQKDIRDFKHKERIKELIKDKDKDKDKDKEIKEKDKERLKELIKDKDKEKERKEIKEKEFKEVKEKEKEFKEIKEKEKDKEFEGFDNNQRELRHNVQPYQTEDIEGRLGSLEMMIGELTHFITTELRPDLVQGAQDYAEHQNEYDPEKAAQIAKDEKDFKDTETF